MRCIGQVYQTVSAYTARLDNIVELYARIGIPQIPGLPEQEPVVTTLTLRHLYEPLGGSTSQITFEDTEVKTTGLRTACGQATVPSVKLLIFFLISHS